MTRHDHPPSHDKHALADKLESVLDYLAITTEPDIHTVTAAEGFAVNPNGNEANLPEPLKFSATMSLVRGALSGNLIYEHPNGKRESYARDPRNNGWHFITRDRALLALDANDTDLFHELSLQDPFSGFIPSAERTSLSISDEDLRTSYIAFRSLLTKNAEEWGEKKEYSHVAYQEMERQPATAQTLTRIGYCKNAQPAHSYVYIDTLSIENGRLVNRRLTRNSVSTLVDVSSGDFEDTTWMPPRPDDLHFLEQALEDLCAEKQLLASAA